MLTLQAVFGLSLAVLASPGLANGEVPRSHDIARMAREGRRILGYDRARREMFQFVDVRHDSENLRYVESVYSDDILVLTHGGIPHDDFNTEHTWPQASLKRYSSYPETRADLYHIFPVEVSINGARGNLPFVECEGEPSSTGRVSEFCEGGFEPPESRKGIIARAMFYMAISYGLPLDDEQEEVLRLWNVDYPPSPEEIERCEKVREVQGNENPFVAHPEWVNEVSDF